MKYIHVYVLLLVLVFHTSCGGQNQTNASKDNIKSETKDTVTSPRSNDPNFHTKYEYTDSIGKRLIIQNSYPRGGVAINGKKGYTSSTGKAHGFGIFWTRFINETASPLELTINFPSDSFAISSAPNSYFKLLLPPDTMTLDKQSLYNYGYEITDLRSFLDLSFNKPTMLQRTVNPKEECLFYVVMLNHTPDNGLIRAGLFSKGQDLFYKMSIGPFGSQIIPCGQIVFNK
jgi:hypothetical protein